MGIQEVRVRNVLIFVWSVMVLVRNVKTAEQLPDVPKSCREAKYVGATTYFTGLPCKRGHFLSVERCPRIVLLVS